MTELPKQVLDMGDGNGALYLDAGLVNSIAKSREELDEQILKLNAFVEDLKEKGSTPDEAVATLITLVAPMLRDAEATALYFRLMAICVYGPTADES